MRPVLAALLMAGAVALASCSGSDSDAPAPLPDQETARDPAAGALPWHRGPDGEGATPAPSAGDAALPWHREAEAAPTPTPPREEPLPEGTLDLARDFGHTPAAPPHPTPTPAAPPAPASPPPAEPMTRRDDPRGFSLATPPGWSVQALDEGFIVARSPGGAEAVIVVPIFARETTDAATWARQAPRHLAPVLPGAHIARFEAVPGRTGEVRAELAWQSPEGPGRARMLASVVGRSGMLYVVAAPAARFEARRPTLLGILRSVRFAQPTRPVQAPPARVRYTTFRDPNEGAFTMQVPAGWKVEGGLARLSALDPRSILRASSPDGAIHLLGGDTRVPAFVTPTPMLEQTGFTEGSAYSPGYGQTFQVMRYTGGAAFARHYVQQFVAPAVQNLAFMQVRDRSELAARLNALYRQAGAATGAMTRLDCGDVSFTFTDGDRPCEGYVFAGTMLTEMQGTGTWQVSDLYGFLATREAAPRAARILGHVVASVRLNPEWVRMQQGVTANVSDIVSQTSRAVSKIIQDTYETTQAARDDVARKWSNTTLGLTDLRDPETGETWRVAAGRNYYWRRAGDDQTIVGTDTFDRPDIDFAPLEQW